MVSGPRAAIAAFACGLLVPAAAMAQAAGGACPNLTARPEPVADRNRVLQPEDLITLTDIGDPDSSFGSAGLSISPDASFVAFPIRRAQLPGNGYCLGIVLLDLTGSQPPRLLDTSTEMVLQSIDVRGTLQPPSYPVTVRPKWSPDGKWIAFLKRVRGKTVLWRVAIDGSQGGPVAGASGEIEDFQWLSDSELSIISPAQQRDADRNGQDEETTGFRYDERFLPVLTDRPLPTASGGRSKRIVRVGPGETGIADPGASARPEPVRPAGALRVALGPDGALAWTSRANPDRYASETVLTVRSGLQDPLFCGSALCGGIEGLWWMPDGKRLIFVRREGWAKSRQGLYVWHRGAKAPVRLLVTDDLLLDCQPAANALICGHEAALQPRSIVRIDLRRATMQTLYDPNPGFSRYPLGRVERLHWTNANGLETYGDLVYPVGFTPGTRYPTIVTTYKSRGFLRGATGDEYPIQLFANHGYAVLSFARPADIGVDTAGIRDHLAAERAAALGWADRRSVQSSIEEGLRLLDRKGVVDRGRAGITGLSDGATTVQFALLNSHLFAAASLSSCCWAPDAVAGVFGLGTADYFRSVGYPAPGDPMRDFWAPMSLIQNARTLRTPLLMQLASTEFRAALSSFTALRAQHQPTALYIFSDEGHVKLQPLHRLAAYKRNLAWFDFWLKGQRDAALVPEGDLEYWDSLRASAPAPFP